MADRTSGPGNDFAAALLRITSRYIVVPGERTDAAIGEALRDVGELVRADRVYIFDYDLAGGTMSNTYEWCAAGIEPQIEYCQELPLDISPGWVEAHRRGEPVHIPDVADVAEESLRAVLAAQGIRGLLTVPMRDGDELLGMVGFDSVHAPRRYAGEEIELLLVFSRILMNLRLRRRADLEREQLQEEKQRIEGEFRQAQKFDAIGRLAGGVAHDFNNLLTVILGSSELGLAEAPEGSFLQKLLRDIHAAAERSGGLTRQLLTFSRRQMVRPEVLDPCAEIRRQHAMLARLVREDVRLELDLPEACGPILIDRTQFDQVLVNLVVNAGDALEGHGSIVVRLRQVDLPARTDDEGAPLPAGPHAEIAVIDTGRGMPPEVAERIFEPFFTTREAGSGLGLSTVHGIVKQHGGAIAVTSVPGAGTAFTIHLPVTGAHPGLAERAPAPAEPARGTETVLVVEDAEANLELAETILGRHGYTVLTASSPRRALEIAGREGRAIDLLLTDVVMPELNGKQLSERIEQRVPGLVTVFMSGYPADITTQRGIMTEGADFLQKPFTVPALLGKVRAALDARPRSGS